MVRRAVSRALGRFALPLLAGATMVAPLALQAQNSDRTRVIVVFKHAADSSDRTAIERLDGRIKLEIADFNAIAVDLPRSAVAKLRANKRVSFVEDDTLQHAMEVSTPDTALAQEVPYGISMVQADQVPDTPASRRKICIIDSGYETAHEDLNGNNVNGENLTTSGDWFTDELHHGTHVGGTVSAVNNSLGVIGVMPNERVKIFISKVFDETGSAPSSLIARAMADCGQHGANVISMSLGGSAPSQLQQQIVRQLAANNVMMFAAAGNGGNSAISYPAGFAEVISVAAVDSTKAWATFSQFNADVELAAPGVAVKSTVPMGTGSEAKLKVGQTNFQVIGMEDSPLITAQGPLADFGLGDTVIPGGMTGKVCLIQRGDITFALKVQNCEASGGVGAAIYNNVPGPLNGTLAGAVTHIPSVGADGNDGAALLSKVGKATTVGVSTSNYALFDGTSMATPHASAVATLLWSYFPDCTAAQMRKSLQLGAEDLGDAGRDTKFGFGLVQAKTTYIRIKNAGCAH
jgi:subtilisin family serine protease